MINGHIFYRVDGCNLKAAAGTLFALGNPATAPVVAGRRYIPLNCFAHLRSMSGGALTTAPAFRIGTNANHNNVCPVFSPPLGIAVGVIGAVPLAVPLSAPDPAVGIWLEMTTAAVGPAVMTADILLYGLVVGDV